MERVRFISHREKQVLLIDASNCPAEELIEVMEATRKCVTAQTRNSLLILTDFTGAKVSRDAITRMKEVAVYDRPFVKRSALVGADSLPKAYYDALKTFSQREFPRFATCEEALEWLTK